MDPSGSLRLFHRTLAAPGQRRPALFFHEVSRRRILQARLILRRRL